MVRVFDFTEYHLWKNFLMVDHVRASKLRDSEREYVAGLLETRMGKNYSK